MASTSTPARAAFRRAASAWALSALSGVEVGPRMDLALLNAGAGLYLGDRAPSIAAGVALARELIGQGLAAQKLDEFHRATNELRP